MIKTKITNSVFKKITEDVILEYPTYSFKKLSIYTNKRNSNLIDAKATLCWELHELDFKWRFENGYWRCNGVSVYEYEGDIITPLEFSIADKVAEQMNYIEHYESNQIDL